MTNIVGRSAASALTMGVLADVWRREERGLSVSIFTVITLLGPTLGPLLGGFITQYSSWRWSFWIISMLDGCVAVIAAALLRETFEPVLLQRKAKKLRVTTGNAKWRTKWEDQDATFWKTMRSALVRPLILVTTQPIFQIISLYISYLFGLLYFVLATFAALWTERYHESISISGINYLSLAIGYIIGTHSCAVFQDKVYKHLTRTRGAGTAIPEFRLPLLVPGSLFVPIGLLWYGWSAEKHLFWVMPDLGMVIFAVGLKYCTQCLQLYALDVYPTYAASANAGNNMVRSLFGFAFPIIAPYLYSSLDYGYGNTVLAGIAIVIGVPSPFLLWRYGPSLRRRSPYSTDV
jgi:MFS family permease